jgi:hypothetical protein
MNKTNFIFNDSLIFNFIVYSCYLFLRFSGQNCLEQIVKAIANDEIRLAFVPAFLSRAKEMEKLLSREIQSTAFLNELAGKPVDTISIQKLSRSDSISRCGFLYSDIMTHGPINQHDAYEDLVKFCCAQGPYMVLHKVGGNSAFDSKLLAPRTMKPKGCFTMSTGMWISQEQLDDESEFAENLSKRWNRKAFSSNEPTPFSDVGGHQVQLESYHHKDSSNQTIKISSQLKNSVNNCPLSFIRLGARYTQKLIRYICLSQGRSSHHGNIKSTKRRAVIYCMHHVVIINDIIEVSVLSIVSSSSIVLSILPNRRLLLYFRFDLLGCKVFNQQVTPVNDIGKYEKPVCIRRVVLEMCALYAYNTESKCMEYLNKTVVAFKTSR